MIEIIVVVEILFKNITKIQKKPININHIEVTTTNGLFRIYSTMWSHFVWVSVRMAYEARNGSDDTLHPIRICHAFRRTDTRTHVRTLVNQSHGCGKSSQPHQYKRKHSINFMTSHITNTTIIVTDEWECLAMAHPHHITQTRSSHTAIVMPENKREREG